MRALTLSLLSFIFFLPCYSQSLSKLGSTSISIALHRAQAGDTILLEIWNDLIGDGLSPSEKSGFFHKSFEAPLIDGKTQFNLKAVSKHAYFDLQLKNVRRDKPGGSGRRYLMSSYLIESGDEIKIVFDSTSFRHGNYINLSIVQSARFFGKGSLKLKCKYLIDSTESAVTNIMANSSKPNRPASDSLKIHEQIQYWVKRNRDFIFRINSQLQVLEPFRKYLPVTIFNILKGNIIGTAQNTYRYFKGAYDFPDGWLQQTLKKSSMPNVMRLEAKNALRTLYRDSISNLQNWAISPAGRLFSATYISMLLSKEKADVALLYPETNIYERIKKRYSGHLRDRILTWYISGRRDDPAQQDADLQNALSIVKDPTCLEELNRIKKSTNVGAKAFNFSLKNIKNKSITLDELRGKVVFVDFWYTGCGFCANYYDSVLSKIEEHYKLNNNIVFVSVSIDKDIVAWIKSISKGGYTSSNNNVINLYTNGLGSAHPIITHYNIPSYPHLLLIDKQGRIANNSQEQLRAKDSDYGALIKRIDDLLKK